MLMGSIGFQMLMFYLVNWPDRDIQRYSWQVISQTISIFCAVLLFQGCNGLVEEHFIKGSSPPMEVAVDMGQMLFWLTCMQIVLAVTSGALNEYFGAEPDMEKVELNLKSWSVLFSHVAGFATINAWGSIQQEYFSGSPLQALMVVPIGYTGLIIIYHFFDIVREHVSHMDDDVKDEFEEKWDEETEEAENDVAGLSLSFLTVQALRFAISGLLPNQEGNESSSDAFSHSSRQCHILMGCGVGFFVLSISVVNLERLWEEPSKRMERVIEILNNYFTFGLSWCFFYGVRWGMSAARFTDENALLMVSIALFLSVVSFLTIFILDKVEDNHLFGEDSEIAEGATEKMISGLGILIGFSWEQSFDTAVDVVAEGLKHECPPLISKMVMSVILVLIVFPAWRIYILPMERELSEEMTEEGGKKALLKQYAQQHFDLFLHNATDEDDLDKAHLLMKRHRRNAHGLQHPGHGVPSGLKHLMVTSSGIVEVDAPEEHDRQEKQGEKKKRKNAAHQKDLAVSLLGP
ncbi:unnamed protein product [Symbiodinium natans]|uniref:Uncharacterized protein n=1 Tax=Symbiodinium natans TaxID=878477 RepID=A0A812JM27_9DINO|nr:unnamed protein product [Symbiodinium natans]